MKKHKTIQIIKDCLWTTLLAVILLGPIIGFILHGFTVEFDFQRIALLAGVVFVGRFFLILLKQNLFYQHLVHKLLSIAYPRVGVVKATNHPKIIFVLLALGLILPFILSKYWLTVAILVLIYILLGLGLNIVVGLAGLLNLGFVAFYAIGAYTYALGAQYLHIGFWTALPVGALLSALLGVLLAFPVLRMYGDYLAIVTLGFGEIIRLILNNWSDFTGGPNGVSVPTPTLFHIEFNRVATQGGYPLHELLHIPYNSQYRYIFIYLVLFLTVCLVLRLVTRLQCMPLGRAFEALREDEIACQSLGINHVTTKLWAFGLGAMMGGLGGVFFAAFQGFVNPTSFTFVESALILAIVVLGGLGSTLGVVLAATLLTLLPEVLREFSEYRMLLFGALMVIMMIWRPKGLVRLQRSWINEPRKDAASL